MIGALIVGLIAGYIGKGLVKDSAPGGFLPTFLLGVSGSVTGYLIFWKVLHWGSGSMVSFRGLVGSIDGVVIVLFAYKKFAQEGARP